MRVAMYYSNKDIRIQDIPQPEPGPGEFVLRIEASGICGSDVMEWYRKNVPRVLGHEVAGVITATGPGVRDFREGDRVSVSHHVPCNQCHYCLTGHHCVCETLLKQTHFDPGGFSEYTRVPSINVDRGTYRLPEEISFEEGTFIEPLACVLRGQRIAQFGRGQTVLVLGSGLSGLLHIQMARVNGAQKIIATDVSPERLEAARNFGAHITLPAQKDVVECVREVNEGRLADRVVLCTGAQSAIDQAFNAIDRGGVILFFAAFSPKEKGVEPDSVTVPLPVNRIFWRKEITLTSSYAGSPPDHLEAIFLIRSRLVKVSNMITHRFTLEEIGLGFQLVENAQESLKVIIEPQK